MSEEAKKIKELIKNAKYAIWMTLDDDVKEQLTRDIKSLEDQLLLLKKEGWGD